MVTDTTSWGSLHTVVGKVIPDVMGLPSVCFFVDQPPPLTSYELGVALQVPNAFPRVKTVIISSCLAHLVGHFARLNCTFMFHQIRKWNY